MRASPLLRDLPLLACATLCALACDDTPYREVRIAEGAGPAAPAAAVAGPAAGTVLRFSIAAIESPRDTYEDWGRFFEQLGVRLGMRLEFVQRRTYREVNDLLLSGQLDAALVCTGGYLDLLKRDPRAVELLAAPVTRGASTYQALIIVPFASAASDLGDLAGKRFAYTDALSLAGHAYPRWALGGLGLDADTFFGSTLFTHGHDRSIEAVASGVVDGAAVHGGVFGHLVARRPSLLKRVRVLQRSQAFGSTPVVASTRLSAATRERLRETLWRLGDDEEGAATLRELQIDGFAPVVPGLYDSATAVVLALP